MELFMLVYGVSMVLVGVGVFALGLAIGWREGYAGGFEDGLECEERLVELDDHLDAELGSDSPWRDAA